MSKQEDFLYGLEWNEKIDNDFAEGLSDHVIMGMFSTDEDKYEAIETARFVVNTQNKKSFDHDFCVSQLEKLRRRHHIFSWLIRLNGVRYDEATNYVHAEDNMWRNIIQVNEFAQAYQTKGDPAWQWLHILFGEPPNEPSRLVDCTSAYFENNMQPDYNINHSNKGKELDNTSSFNSFWKDLVTFHDDSSSDSSITSSSNKENKEKGQG